MMPSNLLTEPDAGADIPASSGTLRLGADGFRRACAPLQSQSSYVKGGGSIGICLVATFALEQLSLSVEEDPFLRCMATPRAELRCSCSRDFNNINAVLPCYGLDSYSEFGEGYSMYLPVSSLKLLTLSIPLSEVLEVLDGYDCTVLPCDLNDFICDLPYPCVDEVSFFTFKLPQGSPGLTASLICIALQNHSSLHELPLLVPYILTKIQLFQNFSIISQNRQSKATAVNINSYSRLIILLNLNLELLSEICDDNNNIMTVLPVQSELSAFPAIVYVLGESPVSTIPPDWQGNSAIAIAIAIAIKRGNYGNGIPSIGFSKFSRTGDVKSNSSLLKFFNCFVVLPLMNAINEDLGVEIVLYFCLITG